jgi:hypothetical protein
MAMMIGVPRRCFSGASMAPLVWAQGAGRGGVSPRLGWRTATGNWVPGVAAVLGEGLSELLPAPQATGRCGPAVSV